AAPQRMRKESVGVAVYQPGDGYAQPSLRLRPSRCDSTETQSCYNHNRPKNARAHRGLLTNSGRIIAPPTPRPAYSPESIDRWHIVKCNSARLPNPQERSASKATSGPHASHRDGAQRI